MPKKLPVRIAKRGAFKVSHAIERALRLQQQLRSVFESNLGGEKDLSTLHRVRVLCTEVRNSVPDIFCRDRVDQLRNFADAIFADRRSQQWARSRSKASLMTLRRRVNAALDDLDRRLHAIMAVRN